MKKITIYLLFAVLCADCFSQNSATRLFEYTPAPGQHINIENIGTPAAALRMTEQYSSLVSLGSFGGYLILGFENACVNHPDNPYGIDFTVFGNAFAGSSEPGVIWVMKDENRNGLPDDTWYEIAGSNYFHSRTVRDYCVTYYRTETRDLSWTDNKGETGWIKANPFNLQEYYPMKQIFPDYPQDSVTFYGTLLASFIDFSNQQEIKVMPPAFGYADCHPRKSGVDLYLPDNPYTEEVEGAGGNPIDISWAVDSSGNYVDIDSIHFVKIVTANLASVGWLGELSTDVAWIEAVKPKPGVTGKENLLVVFPHPFKIVAGDSLQIEACYFERGRYTATPVMFAVHNEQVVDIGQDGWIKALKPGNVEISISAREELITTSLSVVIPESIQFLGDFSSVYPGDSIEIAVRVFDNEQEPLDVPVHVTSSSTVVGKIGEREGKLLFIARQPGETILTVSAKGFTVEEKIRVNVLSPDGKIDLYFMLKSGNEHLLPFQWIEVSAGDLNGMVDKRKGDYAGLDKPVLFHALVAGLKKAGVPFLFRDDDAAGGKLYLYSVEVDGFFYYGWGGKTEPETFARAWIARHNRRHILNDFDKAEITSGDTVALYHISGITGPWIYSRLLADRDSAAIYDEIELLLEQTVCNSVDGEIIESDFVPVVNAEIIAGSIYYTDYYGRVSLTLETDPPLVISSGNNAVLISKKIATGIFPVPGKNFHIYANPFDNELIIAGPPEWGFEKFTIRIVDMTGRIMSEQEILSGRTSVNLSFLSRGMYQLVIIHADKTESHKILRR